METLNDYRFDEMWEVCPEIAEWYKSISVDYTVEEYEIMVDEFIKANKNEYSEKL